MVLRARGTRNERCVCVCLFGVGSRAVLITVGDWGLGPVTHMTYGSQSAAPMVVRLLVY